MKAVLLAFGALLGLICHAQNTVLINEIQASNQTTVVTPEGASPDWIELYNPTSRSIDLNGMGLVIAGKHVSIDGPLKIPARGYLVLWFDGRTELGADHVDLRLSRKGGSLLLIAANGINILDVFTWPELFADESIGRSPDGKRTWKFFSTPTPGTSNEKEKGVARRTASVSAEPAPGIHPTPITVQLGSTEDQIYFTLDGTVPSPTNGTRYTAPIELNNPIAIRAKAYSAEGIAGPEFAGTYLIGNEAAIALITDPKDLWDPINGIDVNGSAANHTRQGREWEIPSRFQLKTDTVAIPVGLRISGSGSRSLAKRSYKVYARNRFASPDDPFHFGDDGWFDEGMIRADASPHAFLRNKLIEEIVQRTDLNVAVQPSEPLPLYINAEYHGLYRWMPPKDAQWLRHISGADQVDVLEGPANEVLSGSAAHFQKGEQLLIAGAPADSIAKFFDLKSLIDLASLDLFTGRADHDLNVRTFRPRTKDGTWKWVMFDMDLWAPVEDNSLERMVTAPGIETPYLAQLIGNSELQHMLLARIAALNATAFSPDNTLPIVDEIQDRYGDQLERDHERWKDQLQRPSPEEALIEMKHFLNTRGAILFEHLADRTGHSLRTVSIEVPDPSLARMSINGLPLQPGKQKLMLFSGIPMQIEIELSEGVRLISWGGHSGTETSITIDPAKTRQLKPKVSP